MTKPLEEELARLKGLVTGMGELTGVQLESSDRVHGRAGF